MNDLAVSNSWTFLSNEILGKWELELDEAEHHLQFAYQVRHPLKEELEESEEEFLFHNEWTTPPS